MSRSDFDFESRLVPLLLAYAQHRGVAIEPLISRHKLPADVLAQPPGKVPITTPISVLPALADDIAAALNDPHLGLELSAWLPRGAYGVAEFLMRAGPTLRHSFANLSRFSGILAPGQTFRFEETADEAQLHHSVTLRPGAIGRHLAEYSTAVIVKTFVLMSGAKPTRAWFTHSRPRELDLQRLSQGLATHEITFDEPTNGFALSRSLLDGPVHGGDAALYTFLEEHAVAALASRPRTDDLIDKVRHQIREALKQGEPNVERLATRLNMSGRTLQRRLSDLKTSFQEVLDLVRFDLARAYLKDVRLDVSQVAYLLGYSELRAFDRAFRRWADKSPTEWRSET
ncbi:MAG: AraC family transcriptional regulator ligand-binding domain-containing protein [Archangium sp.]|nr:AraC family transcriptional regulator ligand-binding domain-containing protein [Archangium sp.]